MAKKKPKKAGRKPRVDKDSYGLVNFDMHRALKTHMLCLIEALKLETRTHITQGSFLNDAVRRHIRYMSSTKRNKMRLDIKPFPYEFYTWNGGKVKDED